MSESQTTDERNAQVIAFNEERYDDLLEQTAQRLEALAARIRREGKPSPSKYSTRIVKAAAVVHEIHTTLMNLPLANFIEAAHEATPPRS